jgi:uncharacterized membrane protein
MVWGAALCATAPAFGQATPPSSPSAAPVGANVPDGPAPSIAPSAPSAEPAHAGPRAEVRVEAVDRSPPRDPPAVAIVVPVVFFGAVVLVVALSLYASFRKDRERHETLRLVIERGGSIPPELVSPPPKRPTSDLRRGMVLLSGGVGLSIFLAVVPPERGVWTAGLVPVLLGVGYLAVARLERGADRRGDRVD